MKWEVKHDRAKKVIDHFLDNAGYWKESEFLTEGLSEDDMQLVNAELELMIASIRKRYKLQERLTEQVAAPTDEKADKFDPLAWTDEQKTEEPEKEPEKPKRGKKAATGGKKTTGEKKATARKPRVKKEA